MRKNLSGKTEFAKHTRNTQSGKRGVNKRERRVPVPDVEQPAVASTKKRPRKPRVAKPYRIEAWFRWKDGWSEWGRYATRQERDQQLAKVLRGYFATAGQFRAKDPPRCENQTITT